MDSGFYFSRAGSRSNSIHAGPGNGFSLFTNEPGTSTPYRNSPADVQMSPYANSIEITPLDLDNLNVAVPIPSKAQNTAKGNVAILVPSHQSQGKSSKEDSVQSSNSKDSNPGTRKETGLINELIERFLEEEPITKEEWDTITKEEQIILNCLIKRKLGFDILEYIKCKGMLKEGQVKCKRLEENYKMVFKGALKYLSSNFKEKKGKKKSKAEDIAFYQYYFGQVATDSNPLETFYHPNK